jgi:predicted RecA/RadA family phage recombinase
MTLEAQYHKGTGAVDVVAAATLNSGEVLQLPDGRAAVKQGIKDAVSGDYTTLATEGRFVLQKTDAINILDGGRVFWDRSAGKANYKMASGDFFVGVAVADAAAADTTVVVDLNVRPRYEINLPPYNYEGLDTWVTEDTNGLGVVQDTVDNIFTLAFDAVAEAAQAALISGHSIPVADGPIFEAEIAIFDEGDAANLDINFGLANASDADDADDITEAVFFHLDGSALSILAESDDGTTEVAATDTTKDAVDDTYAEYWIDARDLADVKLYIDGVRVLSGSTFKLDAATGPMKALVHLEKTSNDTLADVRVRALRVRSTDLG